MNSPDDKQFTIELNDAVRPKAAEAQPVAPAFVQEPAKPVRPKVAQKEVQKPEPEPTEPTPPTEKKRGAAKQKERRENRKKKDECRAEAWLPMQVRDRIRKRAELEGLDFGDLIARVLVEHFSKL